MNTVEGWSYDEDQWLLCDGLYHDEGRHHDAVSMTIVLFFLWSHNIALFIEIFHWSTK